MSPEQAHEAWARLLGREPLTGERRARAERLARIDDLSALAAHPKTQAAQWDRLDAGLHR